MKKQFFTILLASVAVVVVASCSKDEPTSTTPEGALTGKFSVASGKQVYFSKGNFRAKKVDATWTWGFYEHQYEFNSLNTGSSRTAQSTDTEIDLFTWGYDTWSTDPITENYLMNHTTQNETLTQTEDWGSRIGDGNTWRTLTTAEWQYLFGSSSERNGKFKCGVEVCGKANCLIIVPDECLNGYTFEITKIVYNETEWAIAEAAGLVCLTPVGFRSGSNVYSVGDYGYYWSSSSYDEISGYRLHFSDKVYPNNDGSRDGGFSVRLVTDVK